jgi:hypothetical protein
MKEEHNFLQKRVTLFDEIPDLYILTTLTIMVILLIFKPDYTFPGLGIVILGIPVFYIWIKYNKKHLKNEDIQR